MTRSQGTEVRRPSRRTVASGAAWAVPVIAVGAAAPAMAASPPTCVPTFTVADGSFKCCNGKVKNMKVVLKVTDANNCIDDGKDAVCITDVQLGNGQDRGKLVFEGGKNCTTVGGTITVYLLGTDSCTANLIITYTVGGGAPQVIEVKSSSIRGNDDDACKPKKS